MNEYLFSLISKCKNKGILVDTNILLLYLVGSSNPNWIRSFSRTASFTEEDFDLISGFIDLFDIKITTPHILTEVSNLFGNRESLHEALAGFIEISNEQFTPSLEISKSISFLDFGLSDSAIFETAKNSYLVFTDDSNLYGLLSNTKIDAVKLDDIRKI